MSAPRNANEHQTVAEFATDNYNLWAVMWQNVDGSYEYEVLRTSCLRPVWTWKGTHAAAGSVCLSDTAQQVRGWAQHAFNAVLTIDGMSN